MISLISTRLSFYDHSAKNKVLNIESALHNELSLKLGTDIPDNH